MKAAFSMAGAAALGIASLSLVACSTPEPITRIVHETRTEYIPVPSEFLAHCNAADLSQIETNGDLLEAAKHNERAIERCNDQLDAIGTLPPPPTTH